MVKVFIFTSLHNWDDVRIYQKQAKSLALKYEVELHAVANFKHKKIDNINVYGLNKISKRYLRPLNWGVLLYRALKSDAEVFHFHDPELLPIGVMIKFLKKKKVIYDAHENVKLTILNREWINEKIRKPLSRAFDRYEKRISKKLDRVVTVLDEIAEDFIKEGINTIVVKNFQIDVGIPKKDIMKGKEIKIAYAGSISSIRGTLELVESFKYIPYDNVHLDIIGEFSSEDIKKHIMDNVKRDSRIKYKGVVSYHEAQGILKDSDIGVVSYKPGPNHDFCLPNKIFEYMSAGVPIVATRIKYWENNFKRYNNILFIDEVKAKSIAEGIIYLIENKEEANRMGQAGYKAYKENFTWQGEEKKLLLMYEELLKS